MAHERRAIQTPRLSLQEFNLTDHRYMPFIFAGGTRGNVGGPLTTEDAVRALLNFIEHRERHGFSRWAVHPSGSYSPCGFAGVMSSALNHPIGPHYEISWRFAEADWSAGFHLDAVRAALDDAFSRHWLEEVLLYTLRGDDESQALAMHLDLRRSPERDFEFKFPGIGGRHEPVEVWSATPRRPTAVAIQ